jgi:hypothetical protein
MDSLADFFCMVDVNEICNIQVVSALCVHWKRTHWICIVVFHMADFNELYSAQDVIPLCLHWRKKNSLNCSVDCVMSSLKDSRNNCLFGSFQNRLKERKNTQHWSGPNFKTGITHIQRVNKNLENSGRGVMKLKNTILDMGQLEISKPAYPQPWFVCVIWLIWWIHNHLRKKI